MLLLGRKLEKMFISEILLKMKEKTFLNLLILGSKLMSSINHAHFKIFQLKAVQEILVPRQKIDRNF